MATETLDEKKSEATEAPAEEKDGGGEFKKEKVSGASDAAEEKEEKDEKKEAKDGEGTEEKGEESDGGDSAEEEEKGNENKKSLEKEPVTPVSDRPTRERKKVERYSLPTPSRSSASKTVSIEKGRGTQLREIPNVAYKLSKRKPDDNLHLLHTILYGKKAKAQMLKKNIGQFSGFVWSEKEEEKQRMRVKDKLEKCIKEKLIDFCDVLDIPINKSNVRKEELSVKVLEFLEYPKATRDILLADREKQGRKRKATPKNATTGEASDIPAKKKRQRSKDGKKRSQPSEAEGGDESERTDDSREEDNNAGAKEESDREDTQTEEEKDEAEDGKSSDKKSSSKKNVKERSGTKGKDKMASVEDSQAKSSKGSSKSGQKSSKQAAKSISSPNKKQKAEKESGKDQNDSSKEKGKKQSNKPQATGSKDQGKRKAGKKGKVEPTREEMHTVVANILKEVDFNTATLSDILRKLGDHFGVDLLHRKAEVKDIITEAINNMTDDEEDEEGGDNTEAGGDKGKEN